ncbi:MAG: hypothetical protein ACKOEO_18610, partial [Planctomycetaceae bacterium]
EKLRPAGIDLDATALLQFNFSNETKTETLTLPGQGAGGTDLTETYVLSPYLFALQAAGKMIFHVPDGNEDTTFGLELFRISAVFSMEISTAGLEVLAQGSISIGPPELELFDLNVVGVLSIKEKVFAADLVIDARAGVDDFVSVGGKFRLITNVSGLDQEVRVPQRFIEGDYFDDDFLNQLQPTVDPNDDPSQLAYVVHASPPKWEGGYGDPGFYAVMQGEGELYLLDLFVVEAAFRFEVSVNGLFIQAEGGLLMKDLGQVNARGYLEITEAGLITALTLDLDAPFLQPLGIDFDVNAELQINTTDEDRTINPLTDRLLLEPMTIPKHTVDAKAEGLLAVRLPGTDLHLARISGVFSLDTSTERVTIFSHGDLEIGPRGLKVFDMEVTGVFVLVDEGFAADLTVSATGGVPSLAELSGTFRMVANLTGLAQEVPVPQRFIDGGFLPDDFVARLSNSTLFPGRKSYVVPAGAPYLDGTPNDPTSTYMVVMGQGALTLVNAWDITGGFRIKVETDGPVIPIHAELDMGALGMAALHGKVELRLSGLTAAATVDLDLPGLSEAGVDFSVDAELAINTGSAVAEVDVDDDESTPAIVIPAHTAKLEAGGALTVRVPQTTVELMSIQGAFLLIANSEGLSVLATGQTSMLGIISLQVNGAFFIREDGVAGEIDMALLPGSAISAFSSVFNFSVTATAIFNTTGDELGIAVPPRFEGYLSDRAKARLVNVNGTKMYTVPAGAPLANGDHEAPGSYAVFMMSGSLTLASVFALTGNYRMVIANGRFEVSFDAGMSLAPIGQVDASGILSISSAGVYGALQLGGKFKVGPVEIFGAMQLEMNTTTAPVTIDRIQYDFNSGSVSDGKVPVVLPAESQRIFVGGYMVIAGFRLQGSFEMINNPNVISVSLQASFRAYDVLILQTAGTVSIVKGDRPGIVVSLGASLKSGFFGVDGVFEMESSFYMRMNTRGSGPSDQYDLSIPRNMVRIDVNGSLVLLSTLKFQVGGYIELRSGVFSLYVNGSMEILGQSVYGSAFFSSEGEFHVSLGGSIQIGPSGFGVSGSTSFTISRLDENGTSPFGSGNYQLNVFGHVSGSVRLFGFTLGSASISFGLDGSTGRVFITPSITINFWLFSITVTTTFNLFYVKVPRPVFLGGNAGDGGGTAFVGGVLYLNAGPRAHMRNESEDEANEGYVITYVDENDEGPGEILRVEAFGRRQSFRGVTGIVADMGSGNDYLEIGQGVKAPLTVFGGTGYDYLVHEGIGGLHFETGQDEATIQISQNVESAVTIIGNASREEITYLSSAPLWASLGGADDEITITSAHNSAATIYGGPGDDRIIYNGSGPALFAGGIGSDTIQGGTGANLFRFEDDFGYDQLSILGGTAELDFSANLLPIEAEFTTTSTTVAERHPEIRTLGRAIVNGTTVNLLPYNFTAVTVVYPDHGFNVGDKVTISAPEVPDYNGEFTVQAVSQDTFRIAAKSLLSGGQEAALSFVPNEATNIFPVQIFHDGDQTAWFEGDVPGLTSGASIYLASVNPGYDRQVVVEQVDEDWFKFTIPWNAVRPVAQASFPTNVFRAGKSDDILTLYGNLPALSLVDNGGADRLIVRDHLGAFVRLTPTSLTTANLALVYSGVETVVLQDRTADITLTGLTATSALELAGMNLGVVTRSLALPVDLESYSLEVAVRDSLNLARQLDVSELDLRVLGDNAGITIAQPVVTAVSSQFTAPDGLVTLPGGTAVTTPVLAIRARGLSVPENRLALSVDTLSLVTSPAHPTQVDLHNDRDLLLTRWMDPGHLVTLNSLIGDVFAGITWVASISAAWAEQVFDGALNPAALIVGSSLSITLPTYSGSDEDALTVDGWLRSYTGNLSVTADEVEFLGGPGSVKAPGALNIRSATDPWTYRLGTAAEAQSGAPLSQLVAPQSLDLNTRDLAALADGFATITIGRETAGNSMRIGDAYSMTTVKATGVPRVVDATVKDETTLLAEDFVVEGDFRVPDHPLTLRGRTMEIMRANLHTPDNATTDAGLSARRVFVEMQEQLVVSGWIRGVERVELSVPDSTGVDAILTLPGGPNSLKTDLGSVIETTAAASDELIEASGSIFSAGTIQALGTAAVLQATSTSMFRLTEGGILRVTGDDSRLDIDGGRYLAIESGSAVLAGVEFITVNGSPVPTAVGANSRATLTAPGETCVAGSVSTTGTLTLNGGVKEFDHADYFDTLPGLNRLNAVPTPQIVFDLENGVFPATLRPEFASASLDITESVELTVLETDRRWLAVDDAGHRYVLYLADTDGDGEFNALQVLDPHPLIGQRGFGYLISGTMTVMEPNRSVILQSADDVLIRGNINLLGTGSDLVLQSNRWVYVEGELQVDGDMTISGGVGLGGTDHGGSNATGTSVLIPATSRIVTTGS